MKARIVALALTCYVAFVVSSSGCTGSSEPSARTQVSDGRTALSERVEFCAIRAGNSIKGEVVDRAVEVAQRALRERKGLRPYRFIKAVMSASGQMVLVFEDSTLSDTFQVYLVDGSTGGITDSYVMSGLYYDGQPCPSAKSVVR